MKVPIAALLASFATGAALLQICPRLPPAPAVLLVVAACLTGAALFINAQARRTGKRVAAGAAANAAVAALAAVVAAGLAGFSYAAWRAQVRLADELPPVWEERDVRITGIVDDLPQAGHGGVRFAFAVERTDTPGAVVPRRLSLAWFAA